MLFHCVWVYGGEENALRSLSYGTAASVEGASLEPWPWWASVGCQRLPVVSLARSPSDCCLANAAVHLGI